MTDFDTPVERRGTASSKWEKYRDRDILPLWVADMDFRAPAAVLTALHERVAHGVFGYTVAPPELAAAVCTWLAQDYGWTVAPDWLVWLPGLVTGLNVACRAVGEPGCGVLTATPVYPPFLSAPRYQDRQTVSVPLAYHHGRWDWDFARLEQAITPDTRLFLLCNPHNPVGRVFRRDELIQLAEIAERHDLIVCSDEIHCQLVLDTDKAHIPFATLDPAIAARTITLMAPSKTYNIAGLYCSFAIIPDARLRRRFEQAKAGIVPHINALAYTAALAAYQGGATWLTELLAYLRGNRDLLLQTLSTLPGLRVAPIEATYLAWIDATALELPDPAAYFEAHGLGFSDGRDFGNPGFVRCNFGCTRALLGEALTRLERSVRAR